jgi:DNA-binding transcriptional ArsR family regulator
MSSRPGRLGLYPGCHLYFARRVTFLSCADSALAQETRLELFRLLVTCGPAGLPAGVIAEKLGVMRSSLSFHLQQLVHAGLITRRRLSRVSSFIPPSTAP